MGDNPASELPRTEAFSALIINDCNHLHISKSWTITAFCLLLSTLIAIQKDTCLWQLLSIMRQESSISLHLDHPSIGYLSEELLLFLQAWILIKKVPDNLVSSTSWFPLPSPQGQDRNQAKIVKCGWSEQAENWCQISICYPPNTPLKATTFLLISV